MKQLSQALRLLCLCCLASRAAEARPAPLLLVYLNRASRAISTERFPREIARMRGLQGSLSRQLPVERKSVDRGVHAGKPRSRSSRSTEAARATARSNSCTRGEPTHVEVVDVRVLIGIRPPSGSAVEPADSLRAPPVGRGGSGALRSAALGHPVLLSSPQGVCPVALSPAPGRCRRAP
jgi:hypothetical protein